MHRQTNYTAFTLCSSVGNESACNAGDLDSIPGLGRSPGEGKGYPLQYSGLEKSMDCIVHEVTKSRTWLSDFHFHMFWNAKVESWEILGVTGKFGLGVQNEAGQRLTVLSNEHIGHSKTLFQQHKRQLYTWTLPNSQYRNQIGYILCSWRWKSSIKSAKTRQEADYGSDHELSAKFRRKLK